MTKKYWMINHNADLTESGSPMNRTYIETTWCGFPGQQFSETDIIDDFCFDRFGKKTAYVQGVAPCPNWQVRPCAEEDFDKATPIKWGGYKTRTVKIKLNIGNRGGVEIVSEESLYG